MRFLLDENADLRLRPFLTDLGHDVTAIAVDHPPSLSDQDVLAIAQAEQRILITNDRDFGELIFGRGHSHFGVLLFRLSSTRIAVKRERLLHVLTHHPDDLDRFLVVTDQTVRVR